MYYEIKLRYKSVLLQRHSNKTNDSTATNNNGTSSCHRKLNTRRLNTGSPLTMTQCDSDRQFCSTTINCTDNDSMLGRKVSARSSTNNANEAILRVNFKEKRNRPAASPTQLDDQQASMLKRTYSFAEKSHCTQVAFDTRCSFFTLAFLFFRMN